MITTIKIDNLDVKKDEFDKIKLKLEKILKIEPEDKIKELSQKMNWSIDQKDIFIKGSKINNKISYRVEFYYNNKKEGKKYYLGQMTHYLTVKD